MPGGRAVGAVAPLIVAAVLLFGFYYWTASAGLPLGFGEPQERPYNLLTDALLDGQLHIPVEPRPELFELTEPYRPGRNAPYRFHDASLYRGRYYLYFGIAPVLTLFIPWRLVGLGALPEPFAAVVFSLAGFVFGALLLRRVLHEHLPAPPGGAARLGAYLVLGLANVAPFILRSSHVYEVAIAAGLAFSAASAWLFTTAPRSGGGWSAPRLALGGLALGLAVGSRPNLVFLVPLLPLLALTRAPRPSVRTLLRPAAFVLAPLVLVGVGLGLYNHARFDSWTEFGTRYQLVGVEPIARLEPRAVVPTLYYDFLAPPDVRLDFPFVFPDHDWSWSLPEGYFLDSSTTGALAHSPFLLILLAAPWVLRGARVSEPETLQRRVVVLVTAGLAVPLATALAFASTAMRFQADFLSLLIVPALVLWFVLGTRVGEGRRRLFRVAVALAFGWSAIAAVAISITGVDALRRSNPALFATLDRTAEPVRRVLGLFARDTHTRVPLRVAFPERTVGAEEPFLSWGTVDAYDLLSVRTLSPGVFGFSLDTAVTRDQEGLENPRSDGVGFVPGRFYDVVVDVDRVRRRVRLEVDGESRVELGGRLVPVDSRHAWPGRGPRGKGARNLGRFSGTMIPEDMWLAGPPGLESLPSISSEPAILTVSPRIVPNDTTPGRLWAVAGQRGARLFTGTGWRWIPTATLGAVLLEHRIGEVSHRDPGDLTPVLVSGTDEGAQGVVLRHLPQSRVAVASARWHDGAWAVDVEGSAVDGESVEATGLLVLLDGRAQEVVATLGEVEVLRARAELGGLRPDTLLVGRSPKGRRGDGD